MNWRERERLHLFQSAWLVERITPSSHTRLVQVLPGHPLAEQEYAIRGSEGRERERERERDRRECVTPFQVEGRIRCHRRGLARGSPACSPPPGVRVPGSMAARAPCAGARAAGGARGAAAAARRAVRLPAGGGARGGRRVARRERTAGAQPWQRPSRRRGCLATCSTASADIPFYGDATGVAAGALLCCIHNATNLWLSMEWNEPYALCIPQRILCRPPQARCRMRWPTSRACYSTSLLSSWPCRFL